MHEQNDSRNAKVTGPSMLSFLLTFGLLRIGVEAFNGSASPNPRAAQIRGG
jgi:hypothetical protein